MRKGSFIAKLMMFLAPLLGGLSMLLFVIFLFNGPLDLVDFGLAPRAALLLDAGLSLLFFLQHSWMIRRRFRYYMTTVIPSHYADAAFTIVSSLVLSAVVIHWQSSTLVVFELDGVLRSVSRGIFFMALAGMGWGFVALKSFDPFGRTPIRHFLRGTSPKPQPFAAYGPYLWVRHPLYFFSLLLIWSCPDLTLDRFIFNALWTIWIVIGTMLEEKDLVADFGDAYRRYQNKTPMLIPWKGRTDP